MGILDTEPETEPRRKVSAGTVAAVITIVGWMLAAASGIFGDYRNIGDRVTVLEIFRQTDAQRQQRLEDKIDRILERLK
jgi:hypothetical protein